MSPQAEPPSSKAKREQALRSILAARRRQILSQRPIESRSNLNRTPRPLDGSAKDADVLEAQETRHGMYVTAAAGKAAGVDEETGRIEANTNRDVDIEFVSKDEEEEEEEEEDSLSYPPSSTTFSSLGQKSSDTEARVRKNTVSMPESLYNYFRPVESNIPVEDMSQFLYFGQKIQPENATVHNSNNSVESTPTAGTASRRRYSMKRNLGTTTPIAKLEEMVNEEMNIAVERHTVEKNKVSKMKNAFRSPESGVYYRKATNVASNVIGNGTGRSDPVADKFRDDNQARRERGGSAAHVAVLETRNATDSTQIPTGQIPVSSYEEESEIEPKDRPTDASSKSRPASPNGVESAKPSKAYPRKRKNNDPSTTSTYRLVEEDAGSSNPPRESTSLDEKIDDEASHRRSTLASRESNNIETSTSREKLGRSSTESWTSPQTSTLRIVVTEGRLDSADEYTVKPADSTEERVGSLDVPNPPAESRGGIEARWKGRDEGSGAWTRDREEQQQQQQQQHVYAYTITNVTRLLRNYTGPGLSRREEEGEASTGTSEIRSGPRPQEQREPEPRPRQPPPPPLLPPRGGGAAGIVEAGRAPAELSAGTTVEPAAAGGEALAQLVGERQRKAVVAVGAHHQSQRAANRGAQSQPTGVNKSGPRSGKTAEAYQSRGGVRWNPRAKPRSAEIEGPNDRNRFLRKSASAVLNQRAGPEGEEDRAAAGKRRRLTNGQRRIKGTTTTRNVGGEDSVKKNGSTAGVERNSRLEEDATRRIVNGTRGEGTILENATVDTMQRRKVSFAPSLLEEDTVDLESIGGGGLPPTTVNADEDGSGGGKVTEAVTAFDTKDESGRASEKESGIGADNGAGNGWPTVTVTAAADDETIAPKQTTTPFPAPVFPVTPRIIAKADPIETFTSNPTEAPTRATDTKTVDSPVVDTGKAAHEDRGITTVTTTGATSSTTEASTTTTTTTTIITTTTTSSPTVQIEISTIPQDRESATTTVDSRTPFQTPSPSILAADLESGGGRGSAERSPEVRGRNLSDKSQDASTDKDDVLPIMHLYNTSDIFNNTGQVNSFSRGTERRVEQPAKQPSSEPSRTSERSDATTPRSAENWTRGPETRRHEEVLPATGPGRGGSSMGNRTRHRSTVYHHPILPEYNTSVLYPTSELNRTLFETGLISVSPRESVNISEVISKRHDGDAIASQETVAVVSYILATLVVFPIAVGVGLILRRLILRNRKVSDRAMI